MALSHLRGWSPEARSESGWYFPIRPLWDTLVDSPGFPDVSALNQLYQRSLLGRAELSPEVRALRFVDAGPKRRRSGKHAIDLTSLYEGRIVLRGEVPTRADDWHDFFNALSFAAFPRAKWALHARGYQLLARSVTPDTRRLPAARTREQDALALFDEGGVALVVPPDVAEDLGPDNRALDELALSLWREGRARLVPFGHALYEHLVEGLACPLGMLHAVRLDLRALAPEHWLDALDASLSRDLSTPSLFSVPSTSRGLSLSTLQI
ncbi:MAG TPA: DUF3025 domain-containing protein [Polyangiales bacterium]